MKQSKYYPVIVVGGGHAGTEAALASARMGVDTLLITHNVETLGQMSCNPAIGGIGKGHLVKEIDALGGFMAKAIDSSGIQFRTLNASKGPAVRATRAQADRILYKAAVRYKIENQENLTLFQQPVDDLIIENQRVKGVITQMGLEFFADKIILTSGTFLGGIIHIGKQNYQGGRAGDAPANVLSERLRSYDLGVGRLKTGTPPRLDGRTIDYSKTEEQKGDEKVVGFSYKEKTNIGESKSCFITYTSKEVHEILKEGFEKSPMFTGRIQGLGPRYCPSIEDKIVRFSEKERHQLFIEPEGRETIEIYLNGFSTSLPEDVQLKALRKVKGLEKVKLFRAGYAIEYDYFPPTQLKNSLETKLINNLFFCGQINGTTGYEEAACQGLIAGINAHQKTEKKDEFILSRSDAYIGVLIDDLIIKGTDEPYRMFTSRAEYRLLLRQDNADIRLTQKGHNIGLASDERLKKLKRKIEETNLLTTFLKKQNIETDIINKVLIEKGSATVDQKKKLHTFLSRPQINYNDLLVSKPLRDFVINNKIGEESIEQAEIEIKYGGYLNKEAESAKRLNKLEGVRIPNDFNYEKLHSISTEAKEKLKQIKPNSIGQASRISGVSPSDINVLLIYMGR